MSRSKLLQLLIGLALVLLLGVKCSALQPVATPDRIATRVAEEKAVAGTLTAEAPKATLTPLPMETPKPTLTQTPTATPTASPIPPTETPKPTLTQTPTATPTTSPIPPTVTRVSGITITGVIANLKDAKKYIAEDSYLQLVFVPTDGKISFETDGQGRLRVVSELGKSPFQPDGVFTFKLESLKSGSYRIVAQLLQNYFYYPFKVFPYLVRGKQPVAVEIPQSVNLPLTIDVGNVEIPLP